MFCPVVLRFIPEYFNAVFLYGAFEFVVVVVYRIQHESQEDISPLCGVTVVLFSFWQHWQICSFNYEQIKCVGLLSSSDNI